MSLQNVNSFKLLVASTWFETLPGLKKVLE